MASIGELVNFAQNHPAVIVNAAFYSSLIVGGLYLRKRHRFDLPNLRDAPAKVLSDHSVGTYDAQLLTLSAVDRKKYGRYGGSAVVTLEGVEYTGNWSMLEDAWDKPEDLYTKLKQQIKRPIKLVGIILPKYNMVAVGNFQLGDDKTMLFPFSKRTQPLNESDIFSQSD